MGRLSPRHKELKRCTSFARNFRRRFCHSSCGVDVLLVPNTELNHIPYRRPPPRTLVFPRAKTRACPVIVDVNIRDPAVGGNPRRAVYRSAEKAAPFPTPSQSLPFQKIKISALNSSQERTFLPGFVSRAEREISMRTISRTRSRLSPRRRSSILSHLLCPPNVCRL
jgi:hypothetical protein